MPRRWLVSIPIAIAIGVTGAWRLLPHWQLHRAITGVGADDASERAEAWTRFERLSDRRPDLVLDVTEDGVEVVVWRVLDRLNTVLVDAGDDALIDGAAHLTMLGSWGWSTQPVELVLREMSLTPDDARAQADVASRLGAAPSDAPADALAERFSALLRHDVREVQSVSLAAACGFAGPARGDWLAGLDVSTLPPDLAALHEAAVAIARGASPDFERAVDDPGTLARLAADPMASPERRLLAAWRGADVLPEVVLVLLTLDVLEPDGPAYVPAMVAERRLDREDATACAEQWLRSFNDDEKRAGALLAALLGTNEATLRAAYDAENMPAVRRTMRLALLPFEPDAPELHEFAMRAFLGEGRFDPDAALMLLRAGYAWPLRVAWRLAEPDDPEQLVARLQARSWLIERFVPPWFDQVGRAPGDARFVEYERWLTAYVWLTARRLVFNPQRTVYTIASDAPTPTSTAPSSGG